MDTRFLETLVALVDGGSIAAAACRLNITPAAVARRIGVLEAEMGHALVGRSGRVVRPTAAGLAVVERARVFLNDLRDLTAIAAGPVISGELRVGAIATALTGIMPPVLERLLHRHSRLEIFLEPGLSMELYGKVLDGQLDAAVLVQPRFTLPKTCRSLRLRREELIVLAPAACAGAAPLSLLREQPFIRYDRNQWGGQLADQFLRQHKLKPMERFELDALDAIAVMVARGLGVSIVPDWSEPWPATAPLAKIPLPEPKPARDLTLIWLNGSPRQALVSALLDALGPEPGE